MITFMAKQQREEKLLDQWKMRSKEKWSVSLFNISQKSGKTIKYKRYKDEFLGWKKYFKNFPFISHKLENEILLK